MEITPTHCLEDQNRTRVQYTIGTQKFSHKVMPDLVLDDLAKLTLLHSLPCSLCSNHTRLLSVPPSYQAPQVHSNPSLCPDTCLDHFPQNFSWL